MAKIYLNRHPFEHSFEEIKSGMFRFEAADNDFEPVCLRGNVWELVKLDIMEWTNH